MLEHRFTVEGYIAFLAEFDEETPVRRAGAGRARAAPRHAPRAPAALSAEQMTMRSRSCSRSGRRSGARRTRRARSAVTPAPTSPAPTRSPRSRLGRLGTLGGLLALGALFALGDRTGDLLDLDARRLDLGDDLVTVGQQRHVVGDRQIADVDASASKSTSDSTEYSIDCGQVVRQRADRDRLDRVEERAAAAARRPASRRWRRAARRPSAPRSSGRGRGRRGAAGG